jgi:hypothetical protein
MKPTVSVASEFDELAGEEVIEKKRARPAESPYPIYVRWITDAHDKPDSE